MDCGTFILSQKVQEASRIAYNRLKHNTNVNIRNGYPNNMKLKRIFSSLLLPPQNQSETQERPIFKNIRNRVIPLNINHQNIRKNVYNNNTNINNHILYGRCNQYIQKSSTTREAHLVPLMVFCRLGLTISFHK